MIKAQKQDGHLSWIRGWCANRCTGLAIALVPSLPGARGTKWQLILGERAYSFRMYTVGVVNKISREWFGSLALSTAAPSIVSILAIWRIPRNKALHRQQGSNLRSCLRDSPSQMGQDALALLMCEGEEPKFFVEAGACDGYFSSNTWLLESQFGWTGILCEPGQVWHEKLLSLRHCTIDTRALWSTSGNTLQFHQTELPNLSTIEGFTDVDMHAASRRGGENYEVASVSLVDLLDEYEAPNYIDFLSLDTEGTEFEILSEFPFGRYSFGVIVCEHNNTARDSAIRALLIRNGYTYLNELGGISLGDAWFVGPKLQSRLSELRSGRI